MRGRSVGPAGCLWTPVPDYGRKMAAFIAGCGIAGTGQRPGPNGAAGMGRREEHDMTGRTCQGRYLTP